MDQTLRYSMRRLLHHWTESSIILNSRERSVWRHKKAQKRGPFPSWKTDRLPDLRVLPGHWSQWFCRELCRPIYNCSSKWWYSGIRLPAHVLWYTRLKSAHNSAGLAGTGCWTSCTLSSFHKKKCKGDLENTVVETRLFGATPSCRLLCGSHHVVRKLENTCDLREMCLACGVWICHQVGHVRQCAIWKCADLW